MAELHSKYRKTAFLSIAIIVSTIFLIKEYSEKNIEFSSDEADPYNLLLIYLIANLILCIIFIYYYNRLDNVIKNNPDKTRSAINTIETYYSIINIFSIPFIFIVVYKIFNKIKPTLDEIPPEFSVMGSHRRSRYY